MSREGRHAQFLYSLAPLFDRPACVEQFPVEMIVSTGNLVYGRDIGVISFIDDMALYCGLRTEFALKKGYNLLDFRHEQRDFDTAIYLAHFRAAGLKGEIEFRVQDGHSKLIKRFEEALSSWRRSAVNTGLESYVMDPPIVPTPESLSASWTAAFGWVAFSLFAWLIASCLAFTLPWLVALAFAVEIWTSVMWLRARRLSAMAEGRPPATERFQIFTAPYNLDHA